MKKILYIDCTAGIAGDMTVAAFLDLGVPLEIVEVGLAKLGLPPSSYRLEMSRVLRQGVSGTWFQVHTGHHHDDDHNHVGHHHHRHYADIAAMLEVSSLEGPVKATAQKIFHRLAVAESKVHGVEIEKVHFHEVGNIDSIVDIVATALCLHHLGIEQIHAAPLPYGSGFVETAHGRLPVPAPATAELLRGLPVHGGCGPGERVTPTGAAIVASLASGFGQPPAMTINDMGSGAGTKDFPDLPNILRLLVGSVETAIDRDEVTVLETHIDDMNPELYGYLMERLFDAGALDVAFSPLQMKKNRPATRVTVVAPPDKVEELGTLILTESTAIGVRYYPARRLVLDRSSEERPTSLGPVRVKVITNGSTSRVMPEFEECRRLALSTGLPLMDVYRLVEREVSP